MRSASLTKDAPDPARPGATAMLALVGLSAILAGCIQVKPPEKPIEINLNVNIRHEVIVKLQQDAQQLIQENPELFPQ